MRRSWSAVNLVGRVKSTARMRRRPLRRPPAPRGAGPPWRRSTSAAIASALRTCRTAHAATSRFSRPAGLRRGRRPRAPSRVPAATSTRIVRPLRAARGRPRRSGCAARAQVLAHRGLVALADLEAGADGGEHARAADQHGLERAPGGRRAARAASISAGTPGRRTCAGRPARARPRRAARRARARRRPRAGRAARGRCTSRGRARRARRRPSREHASSPMRTMVSAAVISPARGGRAASSTPPWSGTSRKDDRAVLALDREVGVEHQRDVARVGVAGEHRLARSRRACRSPVAGGVGSIARPVIAASALM